LFVSYNCGRKLSKLPKRLYDNLVKILRLTGQAILAIVALAAFWIVYLVTKNMVHVEVFEEMGERRAGGWAIGRIGRGGLVQCCCAAF